MAENKTSTARVRKGALPGVREIKRPDFTRKAADIERAEAERVLKQGDAMSPIAGSTPANSQDASDEELMKQSQEAQEEDSENGLDEAAISDEPKWYVAHTYSGYENKVKANLEKTIENRHLENQIFEVRVPLTDVVEQRNGVNKTVQKKMFPCYVLVRMLMNDETWYVVRNTRGVTGFVGPGSKPVPLSDSEMTSFEQPVNEVIPDFNVGDEVAVVAGVWKDTTGIVSKVDNGKKVATINIALFDRETPVEISFSELRKTNNN